MCRQDIPLDYLDHPNLLDVNAQPEKEAFEDGYQWFYEGRSGKNFTFLYTVLISNTQHQFGVIELTGGLG